MTRSIEVEFRGALIRVKILRHEDRVEPLWEFAEERFNLPPFRLTPQERRAITRQVLEVD